MQFTQTFHVQSLILQFFSIIMSWKLLAHEIGHAFHGLVRGDWQGVPCKKQRAPSLPCVRLFRKPADVPPEYRNHVLLKRSSHSHFAGDSIELTSTLFERWVCDPKTLQILSCHYLYASDNGLAAWRREHPSEVPPPMRAPLDTFDSLVFSSHPINCIAHYQYL